MDADSCSRPTESPRASHRRRYSRANELALLGKERAMKTHLSNAMYGVLDYGAYPIGMLAVAPVGLQNLGVESFGVWTVANAVVSTGGIIASGFGEANIQHVASRRGAGDLDAPSR